MRGYWRSAIRIWTLFPAAAFAGPAAQAAPAYDVAAYYFPGFHHDARNDSYLGADYTEWRNIKAAKPGYDGHFQPRVPTWGYLDESRVEVMEKKIDFAADHGVTAFIYDWYWYDNKPFLEAPLNEGILKAKNKDRIKFYLMWANHDWLDIFPLGRPGSGGTIWPGAVNRATFDNLVDHVIKDYFKASNYYKIDGAPVFSIYELGTFVNGLGGMENAKAGLDSFRAKVKAAGFPDLHLNCILWGNIPSTIGGVPGDKTPTQGKTVEALGFGSLATYTWTHYVGPIGDYIPWAEKGIAAWSGYDRDFATTYYPNVTIGWDTNPRRVNYDANHITGNTPNRFAAQLWKARKYLDGKPTRKKLIMINSFNEWPEGSYLEPDTVYESEYAEAVRDVMVRNWSNVAASANGGKAAGSTEYRPRLPALAAIDGERAGVNWGTGGAVGAGWNDSTEYDFPDWLQVDFNGPKTLGRIEVYTLHNGQEGRPGVTAPKLMGISERSETTNSGITDFEVQYWTGTEWKAISGGTVQGNKKVKRMFPVNLTTGKIRLSITGAMDGYSRVTEFEAWGRDATRGCTNPASANYDSTAGIDDGSCVVSTLPFPHRAIAGGPMLFRAGSLELPMAQGGEAELADAHGRIVFRGRAGGDGRLRIPRAGLARGMHWLLTREAGVGSARRVMAL